MARAHPDRAGATGLIGRRTECATLDGILAALRQGESRALVVRGMAGAGKTALLEYAVGRAADLRVLRASGVQSEMQLPFAALHQLCAPLLDRLDELPPPQRDALHIVFGLRAGPPPELFLVGLAVLSLLSHVGDGHPLLCVVDDSDWLDEASAGTLGFVGRRLRVDAVGLLIAARSPGDELQGLPDLAVRGLADEHARALLTSVVGFPLDDAVRDRILAETMGNPLALVELPRGLSPAELAGGFGLLGAEALPGRIEDSFLRRFDGLPEDAKMLLLVAAAEPVGDPLVLWRAAERLGVAVLSADAETEGLLTIRERVTFRHPLVRSAVYRSASASQRRAVHLALADVSDRVTEPDRRAWHLAVAARAPDEDVAAELERSAGRAQARGGLSAAAAFLNRSVALTSDPARRADRALAAAQASLQAGAPEASLRMLTTAEAGVLDATQQARADLLRGRIASASGAGRDAPALLLRAARRFESMDPSVARETYLDAWGAALFAGSLATSGSVRDVSTAALGAPAVAAGVSSSDTNRPCDLLLDGLARLIADGRLAAAPTLARAVTAFRSGQVSVDNGLQWGVLASTAAVTLWDFDGWDAVLRRQLDLARGAGALAPLSIVLHGHGIVVSWAGDLAGGAAVVAEADAVTEATGIKIAPYGGLLLAALRGHEEEASALIGTTIEGARANGEGLAVQYAHWSSAVLYNGLGRYEDALRAARQASVEAPELFLSHWALPELVEAASRSGQAASAAEAIEALGRATDGSNADWGLGLHARSRALLSESSDAVDLFEEAITRLGRTRLRTELARAHLLYGEWLRRHGRRLPARSQLRTAHEMLASIGMHAFAERARHELLATGVKVRRPSDPGQGLLTAQERQIAGLASEGLSNSEIGARLFLSPRTVEWHLRKVFEKLGITSRRDLRDVLPRDGFLAAPA